MKFNNHKRRHRITTNNEFKVKKLYFFFGDGVINIVADPYILYAKNIKDPELKILKCISYE